MALYLLFMVLSLNIAVTWFLLFFLCIMPTPAL